MPVRHETFAWSLLAAWILVTLILIFALLDRSITIDHLSQGASAARAKCSQLVQLAKLTWDGKDMTLLKSMTPGGVRLIERDGRLFFGEVEIAADRGRVSIPLSNCE